MSEAVSAFSTDRPTNFEHAGEKEKKPSDQKVHISPWIVILHAQIWGWKVSENNYGVLCLISLAQRHQDARGDNDDDPEPGERIGRCTPEEKCPEAGKDEKRVFEDRDDRGILDPVSLCNQGHGEN